MLFRSGQTFATVIAWGVKNAVHSSFSAALDPNGSLPATTTSNTPVVISTSNAADFVFAAYIDGSNAASPGSGWTQIDKFDFMIVEYQIVTTTLSNVSATISGDTIASGVGHAVKSL